jgi:hypothetical protein
LLPLPFLHQSAFAATAAYALRRCDDIRRGDAIEGSKKIFALFIGPPLYAFYRQLTVSNNGLLTRGYHDSHPPMHRCLPLWLSLKHIICVCLQNTTLQSTIASRKAGGCMAL